MLDRSWRGSGDSKLNEVITDQDYYSGGLDEQIILNSLQNWYSSYKHNTRERVKFGNPQKQDKLIMAIIYAHNFTSAQDSDETRYDFEHIATKKLMRDHLSKFDKSNNQFKLPVSSIGNICLLPEFVNRRKQYHTLYQDKAYTSSIEEHDLTLSDIEAKYSFTKESDLLWIEKDYSDFFDLQNEYYNFIDNRFKIMSNKVVESLYGNPYA